MRNAIILGTTAYVLIYVYTKARSIYGYAKIGQPITTNVVNSKVFYVEHPNPHHG